MPLTPSGNTKVGQACKPFTPMKSSFQPATLTYYVGFYVIYVDGLHLWRHVVLTTYIMLKCMRIWKFSKPSDQKCWYRTVYV